MAKNLFCRWGGYVFASAIVALFVYLAFRAIFPSGLTYLIAFIAVLHIVGTVFCIIEKDSFPCVVIKLFCGWISYSNLEEKFGGDKDGQGLIIYIILWVFGVFEMAIVPCVVLGVVIAFLSSPIAYLVCCLKKPKDEADNSEK